MKLKSAAKAMMNTILKGKDKVTVPFQAAEGNSLATVFGLCMIRADEDC